MSLWLGNVGDSLMDWAGLETVFPYYFEMRDCVQDSRHHAEGDVWTHTRMVADCLPRFGFTGLVANLTTLFHDCMKPATRTIEWNEEEQRNQIRHPHHARRGAQEAWRSLWLAQVDLETRLAVYGLILWHQKVFHLWDDPDMERSAQKFAVLGSWDNLIAFARADNAGRICANPQRAEDDLVMLQEWIAEHVQDLDADSRMGYFEKDTRSKHFVAPAPTGSRVTVMSGLPGAGKDHWIAQAHSGKAVVSLDAVRRELGVRPTDDQGTVLQTAFERAREQLRKKSPFVWNATGLTRLQRGKIIRLCRQYDAHVTIEALDRPLSVVLAQNRDREHAVPDFVVHDLAKIFEPPSLIEAHDVKWV